MDDAMTDNAAFIKTMRKRFSIAQDAAMPHNERAADDLRMVAGFQWADADKNERDANGRPCVTVNLLAQNVRQVTGQIRAINPAIRVAPADSDATKDVAEIMEGMVRHIENRSDASSVYEAAAESAAACSMGYWRIRTEYCEGDTFDQEALIERIHNPFAVFFDPFAKDPTRKDAQFCFVVEDMELDAFKEAYPNADTSDFTSDHRPADLSRWTKSDTVVIAEYFWVETKDHEIGITQSGQIIRGPFPKELKPTKIRKVQDRVVKWAKVTGSEVLEGPTEFPSKYIPVIAVTGEEWHLGEETYKSSVIRFAKDPQIIFNYAESTQIEVGMLQSKAPFMVTAHQIGGNEDMWNTMGQKNRPYVIYKADPNSPGAPQRIQPPVSSEFLMTQSAMAAENIKRTTGIYDASLGARSNETSGVAINARKEESQNSTSIYADNMVKGIAHTGCILLQVIKRIYDTKRVVRILGEDGQEKMEVINDILVSEDGTQPINDVTMGDYVARVQVGSSYSSRREKASEGMFEFLRVLPATGPLIGDLMAKMQDWPEADRVAERLRKTLPPGIADDDKEEMSPEDQQAKMQQMQAQQQQQQAMQAAQQIEARKAAAQAAEAEADAIKAQAEARKAQIEVAGLEGQIKALVESSVEKAVAHVVMGHAREQGIM